MAQSPTTAIIGNGPLCRSVATTCMQRAGDVLWVPPFWRAALDPSMHALLRTHGPTGPSTLRQARLRAIEQAAVVVLAWSERTEAAPPEETRELPPSPVAVLRALVRHLDTYAPSAVVIVASDPVDPLTTLMQHMSQRPSRRLVGTGTVPDALHLRGVLAAHYGVCPASVHLTVIGAHGAGRVPLWSQASIGGRFLARASGPEEASPWASGPAHRHAEQETATRSDPAGDPDEPTFAKRIPLRTKAVSAIAGAVLDNERAVLTVSTRVTDVMGVTGVCASLPCVVGADGIVSLIVPHTSLEETHRFQQAARSIARRTATLRRGELSIGSSR